MDASDAPFSFPRPVGAAGMSALGLVLAAVHLRHVLSSELPVFGLFFGGIFPFLLASVLAAGGPVLYRSRLGAAAITTTVAWGYMGALVLVCVSLLVAAHQAIEGRPPHDPGRLIAVTATGGALVGTVAGRYDALNRQKASLLGSLQEATVALSAATTTDDVCEHAVGIATEELGVPVAGVWAVTEGQPLRPVAVAGSAAEEYRPEDGVARKVFESGESERSNRQRTDGAVGSEVVVSLADTGVMCFASPEPGRFDRTDGTAVGLLASATEAAIARADREGTLRTQRRLLEQQNERLEEFTSVVSHDLRNPLSVAKGRVDLAREAGGGEDLDEAATALNDMERLIDDLLALAKQGRMTGETEPVSLSAVAGGAWENVRTGEAELRVDDAEVDADPDRLRQLFENLFGNSVEHGSTSSRTASDDSVEHTGPDPTVDVGPLDGEAGFYVADDGPGIDPSDRDRIFEVGYTDHENGTGFGLAIVKRIAEAHGWSVDVTTGIDGGARFEFRSDGDRSGGRGEP